jgi:NitT/TauT family transport system permease protein
MRPPPAFLCVLLGLLACWWGLHLVSGSADIPAPAQTLARLATLLCTLSFWDDTRATFGAFALAFLVSLTAGMALGLLLAAGPGVRRTLDPILSNFQALPKVTLYPIVLASFGLGLAPKVAFGVMHAVVPMAVFTARAIAQLRPVHWRSARVLRLSRAATLRRIILPAILPELVAAARISASLCLLGVLIGEMFAAKHGLGFAAMSAVGLGDTVTITAIGAFLVIVAVAGNLALLALERALQPWISDRGRA